MIIRPYLIALFVLFGINFAVHAAAPGRTVLADHVPAAVSRLTANGRLPAEKTLTLAIGLPLRNQAQLDELLGQIYDPASTNFHQYLTPQEFTARFGPTKEDYTSLISFVQSNGLRVVGTHPNRVVLDVAGPVTAVEQMFGVTLRTYSHPLEARDFYAPDIAPSHAAPVKLLSVAGLDNYSLPHPLYKIKPHTTTGQTSPQSGSGPNGYYRGNDFRAAYVPGTTLTGAGQSVGLLQFDNYYSNDIASYIRQAGITTSVTLSNVPAFGTNLPVAGGGSVEVSLDIEMVIAMAPGLKTIYVYEGTNGFTAWSTILSHMVNDNLAKQLSCSWGGGSVDAASEQIFKQMSAQGQTFFNASGDSDAFTSAVTFPSDSTNITQVGGTTLSTSSAGGAYASETVWNWGGGEGSSGGVSTYYKIPYWQTNISMAANGGSTSYRNIPDVALTADNVNVIYSNGVSGSVGGTSCAAPLWAGFTALINQQAALAAKPSVGFLNPAIYALTASSAYAANFHDITAGNNTSTASPTKYYAVTGYDLCTGLGTPNGTNFINTLVPLTFFSAITNGAWTLETESAIPTNGLIDPGETVTIGFQLANLGNLATTNLMATLLPTAAILAPSGPQNYGSLAAFGGTASRDFTFTAVGTCNSNFIASLQLTDGTNNLGTVNYTLKFGGGGGLVQNFDGVTPPTLPTGWTSTIISGAVSNWVTTTTSVDTAPNSIFNAESAGAGQSALVSPPVTIVKTNAMLTFRQNYSFEYVNGVRYDGGVLEIKIGTSAFADILAAGGTFSTNGYNAPITATSDNPLGGRSAWNRNSGGWKTVGVKLPAAAAGQTIQLRWNCATDTGNSGTFTGWYVDSIAIADAPLTCNNVYANLFVSQSLATNSLSAGQNLVYTLSVTNLGPQAAANVILTDTVPVNTSFVSASPGGSNVAAAVIFPVGMLPANAATNFTLTLAPGSGNLFTNNASVATMTPQLSTNNNFSSLAVSQIASTPAYLSAGPVDTIIECGSNAQFTASAAGTAPVSIQWSLDNMPLSGATNNTLFLTNVHLPGHLVSVAVTNSFGGAVSNANLSVHDTSPPAIVLLGNNPLSVELGGTFADPGALANDVCAGSVPAVASGTVNPAVISTNTLTYTATDGNGNTNAITRTVIVRDTTPPTILWTFTNLVLAADTNCGATMPEVTGTNFVKATDWSEPLSFAQTPTNSATLPLGSNVVVIAVADAVGNTTWLTNSIFVQEQTPPQILAGPQNQTNLAGGTAVFTAAATACSPVNWQWFFNELALSAQTNSTLTLSNLTTAQAGNYSVVARAAGGASTSSVATLTVDLFPATLALAATANPTGFRDNLKFTAAITLASATGTVQFFTNGEPFDVQPVVAGAAVSTNLASLPRGTNLIAAIYSGDANNSPATNMLSQIITNHAPIAAPVFYTRQAGIPLNLAVADLATNWSDADGDPVYLADLAVSTDGVTLNNQAGTLFYFNSNNIPDQFYATLRDDFGGTNYQAVYIAVAFPVFSGVAANADCTISLNLKAAPGYTYVLETRADLFAPGDWLPVATNTLGGDGVWSFTDSSATNFPQQFYRLRLLP